MSAPVDPRVETINLLRSIDGSLKALVALSRARQQRTASAAPEVADAADLDGQYGDPVLKFTPRDWHGDNYKDQHFSECPAELLDLVALSCDYFARRADEAGETTPKGAPVSKYKKLDAARARGWAARIRAGWKAPELEVPEPGPIEEPGLMDEAFEDDGLQAY